LRKAFRGEGLGFWWWVSDLGVEEVVDMM
jgi:hypothetical protein